MDPKEIAEKRGILFSTRIRFSPHIQPIKEAAIERVIEQDLLILDREAGYTPREMYDQGAGCLPNGTHFITRRDLQAALQRLAEKGRVVRVGEPKEVRFRLAESAVKDLTQIQTDAEKRVSKVIAALFESRGLSGSMFRRPFLECLSLIFAEFGEINVRILTDAIGPEDTRHIPSIKRIIAIVAEKHNVVDRKSLESAVIAFFEEKHPDYEAFKWYLAQNFYICAALGLDRAGRLFTKELFGRSVFYLDTNVLIDALEARALHHESFQGLMRACIESGIQLRACQVSIDELRHAILHHREVIEKVVGCIPQEIAGKVRGLFFDLYRDQLQKEGTVDLDKIFENFDKPAQVLSQEYGVKIIDDLWFIKAPTFPAIKRIAELLIEKSKGRSRPPKNEHVGMHDALLIGWIEEMREKEHENAWLVTRDTTLPGTPLDIADNSVRARVITLDALLQWIGPIAFVEQAHQEMAASIFSESINRQILPQERFFEPQDFLVFAEMQINCQNLPTEDVETCLRLVKTQAPHLDPFRAEDRERIGHIIQKFLADPGTAYKRRLRELEEEKADLQQRLGRASEDLGHEKDVVVQQDMKMKKINQQHKDDNKEKETRLLRASGWMRISWIAVFFLTYQTVAVLLALYLAEGANWFQRVYNAWEFIAGGFVLFAFLGWAILGKKRRAVLRWPFGQN